MHLFYTRHIEEDLIRLMDQEAIHCSKVLRKKVGNRLNILDGMGIKYTGIITHIAKKEVCVEHIKIEEEQLSPDILPSLAVGVLKNNTRMEWLVEKAVEIGVGDLALLICKRSERSKINVDRLTKIAVSAMKQSKRLWLPKIIGPIKMKQYLDLIDGPHWAIAHYVPGQKELKDINAQQPSNILIGPEGDFTADELQLAISGGCSTVNLGMARLRTETACLHALVTLNNNCADLNINRI